MNSSVSLVYLARQGLDTAALLELVHVSQQILAQRDQRIAASTTLKLSRQLPEVGADLQQIAAFSAQSAYPAAAFA